MEQVTIDKEKIQALYEADLLKHLVTKARLYTKDNTAFFIYEDILSEICIEFKEKPSIRLINVLTNLSSGQYYFFYHIGQRDSNKYKFTNTMIEQ